MRISKIKFDSDKIKSRTEVEIDLVTILVGPNNSGKSQVLRTSIIGDLRIVKDLDLDLPTNPASIEKLYEEFRIPTTQGENSNSSVMFTRPPYTPINRVFEVSESIINLRFS